MSAKGKPEPVPVWEAVEPRARLGVDVARTVRTRLVGREHEVDVLRGALARTRRERAPQLVTLIGVPGIGKSRLVHELFRIVEEAPDLIVWRQGRSLPYGQGVSFWALGEMVKAQAGILETDADEEASAKLVHAISDIASEAEDARWLERHLRPLVGLAREGESGRDEAFAAWRRFLEALAERGPAVLVFEDLHWADDGLLEFVEYLVDWVSGVPLLVVCTARPELLGRRPGWGGGKPNATTLSLAPLSDEETARLVALLLDRAVMPAEAQAELLSRAGGNPLYAEEFVRMTAEGGGGGELPETIQGIIAARLDGLDTEEKSLLQDAAVLGKVFWIGGVASIGERERWDVERRLHELERRQIVRKERRSTVAGEIEYSFWHGLVRDVAYGQIPRGGRADKHRLAAEWTASVSAERLADRADLLAHHYLAAVEFARAAGRGVDELETNARIALRAAGDRALALASFQPAIRYFREAEALWPGEDADHPRLLLSLGRAIFLAEDTGEEPLTAARDALVAAGDLEGAAEAETLLGEHAWIRGRTQESAERLERASRLVEGRPLSPAKAYVVGNVSRFAMLAGENAVAIEGGREALAMAESLGLEELRAFALNNVGTARVADGDPAGIEDLEQAISITARIGSVEGVRAHINFASVLGGLGDLRRCRQVHERGFALAQRFGQVRGIRFLTAELALDAYEAGEWEEAATAVDLFLAEVEAGSSHYMESSARAVRTLIRLARGDADGALRDLARALAAAREADEPQILLPRLSQAAFVFGELGRHQDARAAIDEIVTASAEKQRLELWLYPAVHVFDTLGMLDDLRALLTAEKSVGRWADAARLQLGNDLASAADMLDEIGALPDEARTRLRLAERLAAAGRRTDADVQVARAVAFYRSVGATFYLRRAERVLAASA